MDITIHISDDKKRYSITVDGEGPLPVQHFLLLTREGDRARNLVFGNAGEIGRLLYGLYINCRQFDHEEMQSVIEVVAEDIQDVRASLEEETWEGTRKYM